MRLLLRDKPTENGGCAKSSAMGTTSEPLTTLEDLTLYRLEAVSLSVEKTECKSMEACKTKSRDSAACESLSSQPLVGSSRAAIGSVLAIEKMDCVSEERQIRHRLGQIGGGASLLEVFKRLRLLKTRCA